LRYDATNPSPTPLHSSCPAEACACVNLQARHVGDAVIHAKWHNLDAEAMVRAYDPISIHPDDRRLLLTLDASADLRVKGGPLPYEDDRDSHFLSLVPEDAAAVLHHPRTLDEPGFRVTCVKLGCQKLTIRGGNRASKLHPEPVVAETHGELCCRDPHSVSLALDADAPAGGAACPAQERTILVANDR
jgi:hypothetical protein